MHPSTLRALHRAAELTRQNRFTEALLIAEPVILAADTDEGAEIRRWLVDHVTDFTGTTCDDPKETDLMPAHRRFRNVVRIGPVQVATYYDGRGREKHTAACTAPRCGFSSDYDSRAAAELAARTHRCLVR